MQAAVILYTQPQGTEGQPSVLQWDEQKSHQRPFTFSLCLTPQTPSDVNGWREL